MMRENERDYQIEQDPAYQAGYADMMVLHAEARRRGWPAPPSRRLVTEIMWLERSAAVQQRHDNSLPVINAPLRAPAWYLGRADAIRGILRARELGLE
jgi:hypothetical protein